MKHIKQEDVAEYIATCSPQYAAGWIACDVNLPSPPVRHEEFDQGYSDCYANGESAPETFDYVEGI
jgi:hypothetical protein